MIDRFRQTMTVFRESDVEIVLQANDIYRMDLLPGFELPLARLLAEADFPDDDLDDDG